MSEHGNRQRPLRAPTDHRVSHAGKTYFFTFGWLFGPLLTDGFGQPTKYQPKTEASPFWDAFEPWLEEYAKTNPSAAETQEQGA